MAFLMLELARLQQEKKYLTESKMSVRGTITPYMGQYTCMQGK